MFLYVDAPSIIKSHYFFALVLTYFGTFLRIAMINDVLDLRIRVTYIIFTFFNQSFYIVYLSCLFSAYFANLLFSFFIIIFNTISILIFYRNLLFYLILFILISILWLYLTKWSSFKLVFYMKLFANLFLASTLYL